MAAPLRLGTLEIDCADPLSTATLYATLTGWFQLEMPQGLILTTDNLIMIVFKQSEILHRPPVWPEEPGEEQKQMHLDFTVDELAPAVEQALQAGAKIAAMQYGGENFLTMIDPEGQPFCLCKRSESSFERYFRERGYTAIPNPSLNIDCTDVASLRSFYAELTSWDQGFHETALVTEQGMVVHFMLCDFEYRPPVWPEHEGAQQKHMLLTLHTNDLQQAVEKAVHLGATRPSLLGDTPGICLLDPQGHPFRIV